MIDESKIRDPRNGQYHLELWGGGADRQGIEGDFWFETEEDSTVFLLSARSVEDLPICARAHHGPDAHLRTVCDLVFVFEDKEYPVEYDFGIGYEEEGAHYMFEEGNYACDCNRSYIIWRTYPDFPGMVCGEEIEMRSFTVRKVNILEEVHA